MPTGSVTGGVETWLDKVYNALDQQQYPVTVGLLKGSKTNQPYAYQASHPHLKTVIVDGSGLNREGRVRALMRCIRKIQPDVVMPLGVADAYEAVIRCKQQGQSIRLVIHAQGNLEPMLADLALYRDWIDQVVCPGRLTQRFLIHGAKFPPERVLHIPNGADLPLAPFQFRQPQSPLRIGYIGRLTRLDKRSPDLIAFYKELERLGVAYELEVVGDGPCRGELAATLGGLEPQVKLHGSLSHQRIYQEVLPRLDVLVLLSSSEAFGIVIVEAMIHGVVPVTSRYVGFQAEGLVREEQTGLSFAVGDMVGAANQIQRLAQDPQLWQRLSAQAQSQGQGYTWARSLAAWLACLADVVQRPPLHSAAPLPLIPSSTSRLEQWGLPAGLTDRIRRFRRFCFGAAVPAGGEEWPLYYRHHSEAVLNEISIALKDWDTAGRST